MANAAKQVNEDVLDLLRELRLTEESEEPTESPDLFFVPDELEAFDDDEDSEEYYERAENENYYAQWE